MQRYIDARLSLEYGINGQSALQKIIVNLAKNPDEIFRVGNKVKVGYDGKIKNNVPIGIATLY